MVEKVNGSTHSSGSFFSNKDYEFHDIAKAYPLMADNDLLKLGNDMKENGQIDDIDLLEIKILDGQNRYLACRMVGITPRYKYYDDPRDPRDYALSKNYHRRQMTPAQRANLVMQHLELEREKAKKRVEGTQLDGRTKRNKPKLKSSASTSEVHAEGRQKKGRASQIVGRKLEMSHNTVEKIEKVGKWAMTYPEINEQWEKAQKKKMTLEEVYRSVRKLEKIRKASEVNNSVRGIWERYLRKEIFVDEAYNEFLRVIESQNASRIANQKLTKSPILKHPEKEVQKEKENIKPNEEIVILPPKDPSEKKSFVTIMKEDELKEASLNDIIIMDLWEKVESGTMSLNQAHNSMTEIHKFRKKLENETNRKFREAKPKLTEKNDLKDVDEEIKRLWKCPLCKGDLLLQWDKEPSSYEKLHLKKHI